MTNPQRRNAVASARLIDLLKIAVLGLEAAALAGTPIATHCQAIRSALASVEGELSILGVK